MPSPRLNAFPARSMLSPIINSLLLTPLPVLRSVNDPFPALFFA